MNDFLGFDLLFKNYKDPIKKFLKTCKHFAKLEKKLIIPYYEDLFIHIIIKMNALLKTIVT